MRKILAGVAVAALVLLAGALQASAEDLREFNGRVDRIDAQKITVDNGKGDKVSFVKTDGTKVTGLRGSWSAIRENDWVTVSWSIEDKPRRAHKIVTAPPKD